MIPARYASVRFPGKPLALIGDKPMVRWAWESAVASRAFAGVVVATDDDRIEACVRGFGGAVERTSPGHPTGTDRVAEVAARHPGFEVVANVQGDQPFVPAAALDALVAPFRAGEPADMTTVGCPLTPAAEADPNAVKAVCDRRGFALYFSRSPIPHYRDRHPAPVYHHVGLYAFRRQFLATYAGLPPTPLERCEGLEQLRALEHGYRIRLTPVADAVPEVNTPADLLKLQVTGPQVATRAGISARVA